MRTTVAAAASSRSPASFDAPYTDRGSGWSHSWYGAGFRAAEDIVGGDMDRCACTRCGGFGQPAHRQGVIAKRPIGIALARIDGCPRRAVHDHCRPSRVDRSDNRGTVTGVEPLMIAPHDLVARGTEGLHHLAADLATCPGNNRAQRLTLSPRAA